MKQVGGVIVVAVSLLVAMSLPGCGKNDGNSSTNSTTVSTASQTRIISGAISYSGSVTPIHQIVIVANRVGEQSPAYSVVIKQLGPYTIGGVTDGTYSLSAFMDLGDDMGPPGANEPSGFYDLNGDGKADEVVMKDGKGLTGINVTLRDTK